jgi:hypothetical protein
LGGDARATALAWKFFPRFADSRPPKRAEAIEAGYRRALPFVAVRGRRVGRDGGGGTAISTSGSASAPRTAAARSLIIWASSRSTNAVTGRTEARVRLRRSPPPELALIVGDAVHNLRTALDHTVYEAARKHAGGSLTPQIEQSLMFPIINPARGRRDRFDEAARSCLRGVPKPVCEFIEQEQPYHWSDGEENGYRFHWLWRVHELDRIDKHRRLTVTAAAIESPYVTVPDNVEPQIQFLHAEGPSTTGRCS